MIDCGNSVQYTKKIHMAFLLRFLLFISFISFVLIFCNAHGFINLQYSHIEIAIPAVMFLIFSQAFIMFYFIGVARMVENVQGVLNSEKQDNLKELFDNPPKDLTPYLKKMNRFIYQSKMSKRQTIPWTALILLLGIIGFLLGGAHHTGMVDKTVHSGVIYGFLGAFLIGFLRQWFYLGKTHQLLREIKALFMIPDNSM